MTSRLAWVELARATDVGRVRGHNEDRHLVRPRVIAVADGMGGAQAGEVAAGMAIRALDGLSDHPRPADLRRAVDRANTEIRTAAVGSAGRAGMGTTVTACLLGDDGRLYVVHVGDSRAYLMRDGALRRLTDDHSVVAELVRGGVLTEEQADRHPQRNVITRALGASDRVSSDAFYVGVAPGDVILLCTDGVSASIGDAGIAAAVGPSGSLADAAHALVAAADASGGEDNATVVLVRVGTGEAAAMPEPVVYVPPVPRVATLPRSMVEPGRRTQRAPEPERVLERVATGTSRILITGAAVLVLVGLLIGGVAWAASRSHVVQADDDGQVRLYDGLPYSPLGISLMDDGRNLGVSAREVGADDPSALEQGIQGEGEATALAARVVWYYGLPQKWTVPEGSSSSARARGRR
ncbi:MAG: serine/threonine-protein phosphatase [Thermoleophilia bacterium]|nr:serine/threonine-protein phosphatase [Thermoleophilia bacterium]